MDRPARTPLWFLFANAALVLAAFALGLALGGRRLPALPEPQGSALHLVHDAIVNQHVEAHDPAELLDRALAAMTDGLDEYTRYVPPKEVARFEEGTTGTYHGIGVLVSPRGDEILVRFPFPDGPAEQAGIRVGDRILAIDGTELASMGARRSEEVNRLLRGPAGAPVRVLVAAIDAAPREVVVRRGPVHKRSVKWARLLDAGRGIGYLYVGDFHRDTAREFAAVVGELQRRADGGLRGLVIDLRWNGGGLLDECLALCRQLLPAGNIVSIQRRGSEVVQKHDAVASECALPDLPLVLLVNGMTASASEVLAAALQDNRRATVVGTRTYGKGMVNTIFSWKDLDFRLKLTTAYYYTPNGRNIEQHHRRRTEGETVGVIEPDVTIALDAEPMDRIAARLLDHEVPERYRAEVAELERRLGLPAREPLGPDDDAQLAAALAAFDRGR